VGHSGAELRQAYQALATNLQAEHAALEAVVQEMRSTLTEVKAAVEAAALELAAVYVPVLTAPVLADAEQKTGFRGYSRFDPLRAMEKERLRLQQEVAAIRLEETYVRREYLVGPNGSITRKLAEVQDHFDTWERECQRFEGLEGFLELVDVKYDTPEFQNRWWTPNYWRQWAAGDRICATLELNDFGDDVLPAYEKVRVPREQWKQQLAAVVRERDAVLALVKRHDDSVYRLQNLEQIYLEECRKAMAVHLRTADTGLLQGWGGGDRAIEVGLKKLAGCLAKVDYLTGLTKTAETEALAVSERAQQAGFKASKYGRPKKMISQYPDSSYPASGFASVQKFGAKREKYRAVAQKIHRYDHYDRFDLHNDPNLWWAEMTGRAPGRYYPGLQNWYDRNPNINIIHIDAHDDHLPSVARAVADRAHDDLGDLS